METATLKIRCETKDLVNAVKKYCGIENVIIKENEDVIGVINSLLGSKKLIFVEVIPEKCRIDEDNAVIICLGSIELSDFDYRSLDLSIGRNGDESGHAGSAQKILGFARKKFTEQSKILQEMIELKAE